MVNAYFGGKRSMTAQDLLLDPAIRDWVVLPLMAMSLMVGLGRHYAQQLMRSDGEVNAEKITEMRHKNTVTRSSKLRINRNFVNIDSFKRRKMYFARKKQKEGEPSTGGPPGVLYEEDLPGAQNPMMGNPMAMVDMMKGNVSFMVPNIVMMTFCSYFFAGFVCLKVPFALPSSRFKLMLQRGIDLKSIDVGYVSSLSWYFIVSFGLRGLYQLLLGEDVESDEARMMQMQMGMMGGGGGSGFDAKAVFQRERKELNNISRHDFVGDEAEKQLLGDRYPTGDSAYEAPDLSAFK